MNKTEKFPESQKEIARYARAISHPARLAILQYLAKTRTCISGDISDNLPLSRSTVSQHLKELRDMGLIHGEIEGLKINYCLCSSGIGRFLQLFSAFFEPLSQLEVSCDAVDDSCSAGNEKTFEPESVALHMELPEPSKSHDIFFF